MPFDGATIRLGGERTRAAACELVMRAPMGWLCKVGAPPRSLDQSSKFWALCTDISNGKVTWGGIECGKNDWHDLLVSGWHVVKGRPPRLLLGLEGERVSLAKHTRDLTVDEMSDLLDYSIAWATMRGIAIRE